MWKLFLVWLYFGFILLSGPSYSKESHSHDSHTKDLIENTSSMKNVKVFLEAGKNAFTPNKEVNIRFRLLRGNQIIDENELKEVHTKKIHLLIIDQSLSDYHHVHPIQNDNTKDFSFNFIPKKPGSYRMWIDITPMDTNQQQFLVTELGVKTKESLSVDKKVSLKSSQGPFQFDLKLESEPKADKKVMATIHVTKNGKPFDQLEPVMGAFAHLVGFSGDHSTVLHIHPMGEQPPSTLSDRGGSTLMFHIDFKKPGFVKLFAQFRINEKDVFIPFGLFVK